MQRRQALVTLGFVLGAVGLLWVSGASAAEVPGGGKPVDMPEVANIGATIWNVLTTVVITIVGAVMGVAAGSRLASQANAQRGGVAGGVAGGVGVQFVPGMITGAQKAAAPAAGWLEPLSPWLAQWQGFSGQSLLTDPIVWFVVGMTLYLAVRFHRQSPRLA